MRQVGLGLLERGTVLDASHRPKPVIAATVHPGAVEMNGCINGIARIERKSKSSGHDADDCISPAIELYRRVQYTAVAAEVALPDLVTEHHDVVLALLFFARQKGAAQKGLDSEDVKKIVCCAYAMKLHRAAVRCLERYIEEVHITGQRAERAGHLSFVRIAWPGGGLRITTGAMAIERDDLIGICIRKRA